MSNRVIQIGRTKPALDVAFALVAVLAFGAGVLVTMLALKDDGRALPPAAELGEP